MDLLDLLGFLSNGKRLAKNSKSKIISLKFTYSHSIVLGGFEDTS